MIGLKNSRHFFIQSEVKLKPVVTHCHGLCAFASASCIKLLRVLIGSLDGLCPGDYLMLVFTSDGVRVGVIRELMTK